MQFQIIIYLLNSVLPAALWLALITLAAVIGIARWRRALAILAMLGLLLLILGVLVLRLPFLRTAHSPSDFGVLYVPIIGSVLITCGVICGEVGAFIAIVLSVRARQWGWFAALLLLALIGMLASQFAFSYYPLFVFVGIDRAQTLFTAPLYAVISTAFASLATLAQLLYALVGAQTAIPATTATAASSDDVTLP